MVTMQGELERCPSMFSFETKTSLKRARAQIIFCRARCASPGEKMPACLPGQQQQARNVVFASLKVHCKSQESDFRCHNALPPPASHMLPKEAIGIHKLAAALLTCVTWTYLQHLRRSTVSRLNQLCLLSNRLIWWLLTMKTGAAANQYTFFMICCLQARRAQSLLTMRLPLSRTIVDQPRL